MTPFPALLQTSDQNEGNHKPPREGSFAKGTGLTQDRKAGEGAGERLLLFPGDGQA